MRLTIAHITSAKRRGARAGAAILLGLLAGIPVRAWGAPASVLRVVSRPGGEIELDARRAAITEVLRALAAEAGFEVVLDDGIARPPVDATLQTAPLEDILRDVLRDRNYALVYDGDDGVSQVILLAPSAPRKPGAVQRKPAKVPRRKQKEASDRGPIVVRF